MDALVGATKTVEIALTLSGQPNTSAVLTFSLWSPAGAALLSAVTPTNEGDGRYTYAVDGSTYLAEAGDYRTLWSGSDGAGGDIYIPGLLVVGYTTTRITTLAELRHRVARRLNDLVLGTASAGGANSLTDPDRWEDDLEGGWLYIYGGTGRGQERRITAVSSGVMTTGGRAFSPTPAAGSLYEIHRARRHLRVADYNAAINEAIESVGEHALYPIRTEELSLADDTYEYTIPAGFEYLNGVWAHDASADASFPESDWMQLDDSNFDYEVLPGRLLRIRRLPLSPSDWRLRLLGMRRYETLADDDSFTVLPSAYLVPKAASILLTGHVGGAGVDPDNTAQLVAFLEAQAEKFRPLGTRGINARRLT